MFSYITLLFNRENATVDDIESILYGFYYKKFSHTPMWKEIDRANAVMEKRTRESKGKLVSYNVFDDLFNVTFVRCVPKDNVKNKNGKITVIDYDVASDKPISNVFERRTNIPISEQIEEGMER